MLIENIEISSADYHSILAGIGYPALDEDTIYQMISKEDIVELVIEPSLEEFYTYFPVPTSIALSSMGNNGMSSYVPPTTSGIVIGLVGAKFIPQSSSVPGQSTMDNGYFYANPFFTASNVNAIGGTGLGVGNTFGTNNSYGFESTVYQRRFLVSSVEGSNKVYWYRFDPDNGILYYKSNIAGQFYFTFGRTNNDIGKIPMTKKRSFINFTKGKLKVHLAEILSLIELDLPATLNADALKDQGDKLIEDNLTYWRESSSIAGQR